MKLHKFFTNLFVVTVSIAMALFVGCSTCQKNPAPLSHTKSEYCKPVTEAEVAGLFDRWNHALRSGNPRKITELYAEKSILLPTVSNEPRLARAEKEDYFHHFLEKQPSGKIDLRQIVIDCNMAVDSGLYTFTFAKTGEVVKARYSFTYLWDGSQWLIVSHHSSVMPEAK